MADKKKSVAKAYVQVVPTTQGIKGVLGNAFGGAGSSAGGLFGSEFIGAVSGIVAAAGIGKMLTESILAGADLEQSLGGIETLFKENADIAIENAENAYKTAGMSANQYMETVTGFSASLLQGLGGDTQEAARIADMALTDMSDNANKMGTGMELIQNAYQGFAKQNYTMLDNLKLGYGGTKTEMQRLLKDAQKLTGVKYDISNLADVYEAIHVIQEEMGITGTTAKEAASTLSGSFASAKAAVSDLMANLALGRDVEASLEAVTETVFTFVGNLLPAVGRALSGLPAVLRTMFNAAIRGLRLAADNSDALLTQGIGLVIEIGEAIITALPYLAEAAFELVAAFGATILATDWIGLATDTVTGIQQSLSLAAAEILGHDGSLLDAVYAGVLEHLPMALQGGIKIVLKLADGILSRIPEVVEAAGDLMGDFLSFLADSIPEVLEAGAELVLGLVNGIIECLPDVCNSAATVCMELLATIGEELPEFLTAGIEIICEIAAGLIEAIPDALEAMGEVLSDIGSAILDFDWLGFGEDIIAGIADGVTAGAGALWDSLKKACGGALKWGKDFLGIASPSKVMRDEIGQFIPAGIAAGIDENTDVVTTSIHHLAKVTVESYDFPKPGPQVVHNTPQLDAAPVALEGDRRWNHIEIHIHAAEGMDEDALADQIMYRLQTELERGAAAIG